MNKQQTSLPPISTLLTETAPRIVIEPSSSPLLLPGIHSPSYLSPLLSPLSYASSITRSPSPISPILTLPPIHGDDPPRPLKQQQPNKTKSSHYLWNTTARYSHSLKEEEEVEEKPMETPPESQELDLPPFTQIVLSESGQAILKRRRGRPPTIKHCTADGKHWTFLTPTVWDVTHHDQSLTTSEKNECTDDVMSGTMAAFTSSSMDMVLQMPRKKRGRKPKSHIHGHSCFVWKDMTSANNRVKKK